MFIDNFEAIYVYDNDPPTDEILFVSLLVVSFYLFSIRVEIKNRVFGGGKFFFEKIVKNQ